MIARSVLSELKNSPEVQAELKTIIFQRIAAMREDPRPPQPPQPDPNPQPTPPQPEPEPDEPEHPG